MIGIQIYMYNACTMIEKMILRGATHSRADKKYFSHTVVNI